MNPEASTTLGSLASGHSRKAPSVNFLIVRTRLATQAEDVVASRRTEAEAVDLTLTLNAHAVGYLFTVRPSV